jgi:hypothetical protein
LTLAIAWLATGVALHACGSDQPASGSPANDGAGVEAQDETSSDGATEGASGDASEDTGDDASEIAVCTGTDASAGRSARLQVAAAKMESALDGLTAALVDDAGVVDCAASALPGFAVQEFPEYAVAAMWLALAGADASSPAGEATDAAGQAAAVNRAQAVARCSFAYQQYSAGSTDPSNGVFAYSPGDPYAIDDNGTEFAVWGLATLLAAYGPLLPPSFTSYALPRLEAALDAIEGHAACPTYTNICLMQVADLVVAGQWLAQAGDGGQGAAGAGYVAAGSALLQQWSQFTQAAGVAEYDSPTYASLDLKVLDTAYAFGPASLRSSFQRALDYLWKDVAASTLPERGNLAPPFGRTYDFYYGEGLLQDDLYIEGLTSVVPGTDMQLVYNLLNESVGGYRPSATTLCAAGEPVREVRSTWGLDASSAGKQRYLYITPDFTLGSTSAAYNPTDIVSIQDLPVAGSLGASNAVPLVAAFGDYFDDPGGEMIANGDFAKITHLQTTPASAQLYGDLLTVLRVDAANPGYTDPATGTPVPIVNLATDILVPSEADDLLLDGNPADLATVTVLDPHATVTVRIGSGVLSAALVDVSGLECPVPGASIAELSTPTVQFKGFIGASATHGGVARLVVYHDRNPPSDASSLQGCWARTTLLVRGTSCSGGSPSACAAAFAQQTRAAALAATVQYDAGTGSYGVLLRAASDAGTQLSVQRTLSPEAVGNRLVNGQALPFPPLAVGGAAVGY